jgi:hypothetical protein
MNSKHDVHHEEREASDLEKDLGRVATTDINNYHGLSLKTLLVYAVRTHQDPSCQADVGSHSLYAWLDMHN